MNFNDASKNDPGCDIKFPDFLIQIQQKRELIGMVKRNKYTIL